MSHSKFVHLRVHSSYSLLEGALKIEDLVKRTKDLQMPAVAVTDTGNLFGALEFSEACIREGVKPILGVQLDVEYFDEKESYFDQRRQLLDEDGSPVFRPDDLDFEKDF